MAIKQSMRRSEARILLYLAQVEPAKCYPMAISLKLNSEYTYVHRVMMQMKAKRWIKEIRNFGVQQKYYQLTKRGQDKIDQAKGVLTNAKTTRRATKKTK